MLPQAFTLRIRASANDINIPAGRSLLLFAALIVYLYSYQAFNLLNLLVFIVLLLGGLFTAMLLMRYKLTLLLLALCTAVLLLLVTRNFIFPTLLLLIAVTIKYMYRQPELQFTPGGICIKKTLSTRSYSWNQFNNIVLKDGLLTLDFTSNKVLQLELAGGQATEEKAFNDYCLEKING